MIKYTKGMLIEYSTTVPPLIVEFEFNVEKLSRDRSISMGGNQTDAGRGGYSFTSPTDAVRASQGTSPQAETISIKTLLDATDRMNAGEEIASRQGVQPEIDSLRAMLEPKIMVKSGARLLASVDTSGLLALDSKETISPIIFAWGVRLLPVFLTSVKVEEKAHLPTLLPYIAEATVAMQVIETNNPFYKLETMRQIKSSGTNTLRTGGAVLSRIF